ncbi:MAG: molybdopterin-dependent oxidoreductase [Chloroflexi bacterium]|nr:molybdopterin-dependent oxidoreductase [Chloroflexota bacterium]MCL5074728.1 molybdopterin-dependent oxidoreductase [Chloroflexota bacterium]
MIGQPVARNDALEKVTGLAKYAGDLSREGMLYAKTLRARYPHARIRHIDTRKAEAMPGVAAVITAKDVPGENAHGLIIHDQPVLCGDKVRFLGDPVAVVATVSPEIAEAALEAIEVDYELLPVVSSPLQAMEPDAPKVHEGGNILKQYEIRIGDIAEGFRQADVIVENTYEIPTQEHAFLEPEAGLAVPDPDGGVSIYVGSQNPYDDLHQLTSILKMDESKVRIFHTYTGGAFGGKESLTVQAHLAILALKTGKPVKTVYSREESILVHDKRHAMIIRHKLGTTKEGRLTALEAHIIGDTGAYCSLGIPVLGRVAVHIAGPYAVPNAEIRSYAVYTNNTPAGAFRGFGVTQAHFAAEQQMDILARRLGLSPVEIRLRNAVEVGKRLGTGQTLKASVGLKETIQKAVEAFNRLPKPAGPNVGWGIACGYKNTGLGVGVDDFSCALVTLDDEARLVVKTGAADVGQGLTTVLGQIAAQELGVPYEEIRVSCGNTYDSPNGGPTTASRQTFISGNAVKMAAEQARDKLLDLAAKELGAKEDIEVANGQFRNRKDPSKAIPIKEVLSWAYDSGLRTLGASEYHAPATTPIGKGFDYHFAYGFATQIATVRVDAETGQVDVLSLVAAHDVGRAVNPTLVEGQIHGGCAMGLGNALMERLVLENGVTKTGDLHEYLIPTAMDVPPGISSLIVEAFHPDGPYGAKGVGEASSIPTAPAITNAIFNAIGVRLTRLPAAPQSIVAAYRKTKEGEIAPRAEF